MNDSQRLEETIGDLMLTIESLQTEITTLNKTTQSLELSILSLTNRISDLE